MQKYLHLLYFSHVIAVAICPYNCGGWNQGTCVNPNVCSCKDGYTGTYCTSGKCIILMN